MRSIDPVVVTALQNGTYKGAIAMVELHYDGGIQRLSTHIKTVNYLGNDFFGVGSLGKIGQIEEGDDLKSWSLQMELSGLDPARISSVLTENVHGRLAKIWLWFLDDEMNTLGNPVGPWAGSMDSQAYSSSGVITISVENKLANWEAPRIRRYTDSDQRARFSGDLGCEFVAQMQDKKLPWGVY